MLNRIDEVQNIPEFQRKKRPHERRSWKWYNTLSNRRWQSQNLGMACEWIGVAYTEDDGWFVSIHKSEHHHT